MHTVNMEMLFVIISEYLFIDAVTREINKRKHISKIMNYEIFMSFIFLFEKTALQMSQVEKSIVKFSTVLIYHKMKIL